MGKRPHEEGIRKAWKLLRGTPPMLRRDIAKTLDRGPRTIDNWLSIKWLEERGLGHLRYPAEPMSNIEKEAHRRCQSGDHSWMSDARFPTIPEFIEMTRDLGVTFYACATTMGVMGVEKDDLIEGADIAGAAAFLDYAAEADVSLFV